MLRRLRWVALGVAAVAGLYALAGAVLSWRFDARVAEFRASEAHADLVRRREDIPAEENAGSLFAAAAALLEQVPDEHSSYAYTGAWEPRDLDRICTPPAPEDGEEDAGFDTWKWKRDEMRDALPSLEPFVAALASALERPAVQEPTDLSTPWKTTLGFAMDMLPFRARLLPDRAAESADLLLRLGTKWQVREPVDAVVRAQVLQSALRIVRDVLARDPAAAAPYLAAWRRMLAGEDPVALFRFECATRLGALPDTVEVVRRGEDPLGDMRGFLEALGQGGPPAWVFRWYARPIFYVSVLRGWSVDAAAIEQARTVAGLREVLRRPGLDHIAQSTGLRMLEEIALLRLAETAFAAAAGERLPQLENPFTGLPLDVRRVGGASVIEAMPPEAFRDGRTEPDLFTWEVR